MIFELLCVAKSPEIYVWNILCEDSIAGVGVCVCVEIKQEMLEMQLDQCVSYQRFVTR